MIKASDMRKGTVLRLDGNLYRVMSTQYNKPGRGTASVRAQLMDISTSTTFYRVFSADETLENIYVETRKVKYLYNDGENLHFMDQDSFEQYECTAAFFDEDLLFLKEDLELQLMVMDNGVVLDYSLPTTVTYEVVEAEAAAAGNTASAVTKFVKTDTGLSVQVPAFVEVGQLIVVDTRDKSYVGRG
ncbi:MAG: elongation factor P [Anaerolineae bacterium]|nr:elongation factor P [Anaerolineae bacterium]MDW8173456.1 elongation factor P [Anaerolineae bacterium]